MSADLRAAIDIGTNTMLLLAGEVLPESASSPMGKLGATHKIHKVIEDRIAFVRLGRGVHQNRRFAPEAMDDTYRCFADYKQACDRAGVKRIRAVATSASRDSSNAGEFYAKVRKEIGIDVEIIAGETEAKLSFLGGLLPGYDPGKTALLDIGGGSTEFVALNPSGKIHGQSIDMGCVRARELFLHGSPYSKPSLEKMESELKKHWASLDRKLQDELREKEWLGIAGTPTTLAAIVLKLPTFLGERVDNFRMDRCMVGDLYESLATMSADQRDAIPCVGKGRGDIIVPGAAILFTAMEVLGKDEVVVSSRGLRHGALLCSGS